jgi:phage terminase large subunit-like protein
MYKSLGTEGFVGIDIFKKCRIETDPDFWKGKDVYIGLDLSQTDDNTSVAMVTYYEGEIYGQVWGFYPKGREAFKSHKEGVDYPALCRQGACFATGGEYDEVIDYGEVERFVMSLPERYGVNIVQLGYDRYNAISSVKKFESADEPIECVEIRQHSSVLHPATKLFYEYILSKKFRYFNNKLLEINIQNARCTFDTNMNRYVNKKKSSGKVDMVVSLINAIYLLNVNELLSDEEDFGAQV